MQETRRARERCEVAKAPVGAVLRRASSVWRGSRAIVLALGATVAACGGGGAPEAPPPPESAVDTQPEHVVVLDRPLQKGRRLRMRGIFRRHQAWKGKWKGWVVGSDKDDFLVEFDVVQTLLATSPQGRPRTVQLEVLGLRVTQGETDYRGALRQGRAVSVHSVAVPQRGAMKGGQLVVVDLGGDEKKVETRVGSFAKGERALLLRAVGFSSNMGNTDLVAHLFGTDEPQWEGATWAGDPERAERYLRAVGFSFPPGQMEVQATLSEIVDKDGVPCQQITGLLRGTGGLQLDDDWEHDAKVPELELEYAASLPVDLSLPAVEESWGVKSSLRMDVESGSERITAVGEFILSSKVEITVL